MTVRPITLQSSHLTFQKGIEMPEDVIKRKSDVVSSSISAMVEPSVMEMPAQACTVGARATCGCWALET